MATDSVKNSTNEGISFSEWQFVVKNDCECSDDESIEIIEREILHSVTPSSCSEDEREVEDEDDDVDEDEDEKNEDGKVNEFEIGNWEVPVDLNTCIHHHSEESPLNDILEAETSQNESNQTILHRSYATEEGHVTATAINNFSRKVFYSCVVAAMISVILHHQYRGNFLDIFLSRANGTKSEDTDHSSQGDSLRSHDELKKQPTDFKIRSDDAIVQDLINKQEQFKKLSQKYEMILGNTFVLKGNIYAVEMSVLRNLINPMNDPPNVPDPEPCEKNIDNMKVPSVCADSSGKVFLFMTKEEYKKVMQILLNTMQFDEDKMHNSLNTLLKMHSKSEHSELLLDQTTDSQDEKSNTEMTLENIHVTLREVIEEVRTLHRKIIGQVENVDSLWTTCDESKQDSCMLKNKLGSEQNETFPNVAEKFNTTHSEESKIDDSESEFIYQTAPVTDRWQLKMNSKTSTDTNHHDRLNGEWLFKMSKGRAKYRKRYFKEKTEKRNRRRHVRANDEAEDELYKRYEKFSSHIREKIKGDYKKFSSHVKTKLKKFGDGMKRSYEKLISSDWKLYAQNVLQTFHF